MLKPLGPNSASTSATETFGDLVFCALIVLVLFVLALAIEVSQRVRATDAAVEVVSESEVESLTPEEIARLSQKLTAQQATIGELRDSLQEQKRRVVGQIAALAGEQRFTGAREPASFNIAVDYLKDRYYFVPSRDVDHADTRLSGESNFAFGVRKRLELTKIARNAKSRRWYSRAEAEAIYSAFSQYSEVIPEGNTYRIDRAQVGITYSTWLSDKMTLGLDSTPQDSDALVTAAILAVYRNPGPHRDTMYPSVSVVVKGRQQLAVGGVQLSARDLRDILVSISGRGAMLDLVGLAGPAPQWLREGSLTPAGYIGKVPKKPS